MSHEAAAVLALVLTIASITDLRDRIVPNTLTLAATVAGLALAFPGGPGALILAFVAGLILAFPLLLLSLARPNGMGMGDVKLVAVLGIYLGWNAWPVLLTGLALAGLAGLMISLVTGRRPSKVALPLAPFLAAGFVPTLAAAF
ncbi:MAG: A24 family peptidase [Solirubrobacterales bacterium]